MYGSPPGPRRPKDANDPPRPSFSPDPTAKRKLRVSSRRDEDGQLRVKVHLDGVLLSEVAGHGDGTVTVEVEV